MLNQKLTCRSPNYVKDQIALLDSIYENPAYLEDHPDPIRQFSLLEETIAVGFCLDVICFHLIKLLSIQIGRSCVSLASAGEVCVGPQK